MIRLFRKYKLIVLLSIAFLVWFFSYSKVPYIFFQQDELMGFGLFFLKGWKMLLSGLGFKDVLHFVPVTMSISYSLFRVFGLSPVPYNVIGLVFHTLNGFLIYLIAQKIYKNKYYSIITSILFFSCSAGMELVMWPVINLNTVSLTFSLATIYIVFDAYLKRGGLNLKDNILISILFLLSVFSVEYAAGMIFLIPFAVWVLGKKNNVLKELVSLKPFFITVLLYIFFRFLPLLFSNKSTAFVSVSNVGILNKLIGIFELPFVYFGQLFFDQKIIINISQIISAFFFNNTSNTQFAESVIYKYVATLIGIIIILLIVRVLKIDIKNKSSLSRYILIFTMFTIFSALPFIFVPGKLFSIFPSRYLYFGAVGYSFLTTAIYYVVTKSKSYKKNIIYSLALFLIVLLGTYNNFAKGNSLYKNGVIRSNILSKIKSSYPSLPDRVVFYTESNKSYFGLPDADTIFPFQSGLGQTLFLWYYSSEKFSPKFFENNFLWEILSQDYKEVDNRGFGYFRNYSKLEKAVKMNNLKSASVIAFKWDANTDSLTDITMEVRKRIDNEIRK